MTWVFNPHEYKGVLVWFVLDCIASAMFNEYVNALVSFALFFCFFSVRIPDPKLNRNRYRALMQQYKAGRKQYYKIPKSNGSVDSNDADV
jgi:hypothetical protein